MVRFIASIYIAQREADVEMVIINSVIIIIIISYLRTATILLPNVIRMLHCFRVIYYGELL